MTFGRACSAVSRLDREHLIRHLPRSGIFMTDQGRAMLVRHDG